MRRSVLTFVLFILAYGFSAGQAATRGDFDNDGRLTARDAEAALQMSAGLRNEMQLLDMDGDGRVMSADARIILQSTTGAKIAAASPPRAAMTSPTAPRAPPSKAPLASTPRSTPPPPMPPRTQSGPFYVVFSIHLPTNIGALNTKMSDLTREKLNQIKQELSRIDISQVQYNAPKQSPLIVHVHEAGLRAYSPGMFRSGERFAAPVSINYKGITGTPLKGALLFETIGVFSSESELRAKYPNAPTNSAQAPSTKEDRPLLLSANTPDGAFSHTSKVDDVEFSLQGARLEKGWSEEMKRQNVQLIVATAEMCASQMALIGDPKAEEKLAALRRFRDQTLARSEAGRELIRIYYEQFSPWAKGMMQRNEAARPMVRVVLEIALTFSPPERQDT